MRITITEPISGDLATLEVAPDTTLEVLKSLIEIDFGLPASRQNIFSKSQLLPANDNLELEAVGVNDGALLVVVDSHAALRPQTDTAASNNSAGAVSTTGSSSQNAAGAGGLNFADVKVSGWATPKPGLTSPLQVPAGLTETDQEVDRLLESFKTNRAFAEAIRIQYPNVVTALEKCDRSGVAEFVKKERERKRKESEEQQRRWQTVSRDPLSVEAQSVLLEQIQQQQIDESLAHAQEFLPESFGSVFMLYVKVEVNGIPLKAFVDSGAQATIMSKKCAERCGLMRLIDRRFHGIAQGVGTSVIVGRVHMAQIKMGKQFFAASFTVLEDDKMDFLFGLDLLRRYQCCINLKKNVLEIEGEELRFLSEREAGGDIFTVTSSQSGDLSITIPPTSQPAASSAAAAASTAVSTSVLDAQNTAPSEALQRLLSLGFPRDRAAQALSVAGGNVDVAASILFGQAGL